ncbi:CPXCG motif-containing cysteine-rich protein [Polaribacter batillariae]|uniref:CPXCG motif-containing cysteine-rich protein n=2 Tax=Polaribacter batillariae TaxID=2808900 RepID=A0ABX7SUU6_9FLAO|nr:CPXCG motif-containing cysteine-rich protein [Polaribacter batillariae]
MILDASVCKQTYIEDCEVCCNPIEISPTFKAGELIAFHSESIEQ